MNDPIHDDELNRILLKPRFKLKFDAPMDEILQQFKDSLDLDDSNYKSQIVDHHIVIDVPELEEHFWSPQLHVEIEKENGQTIVRGILGPKPKIWTFFMFLHFIVAIAFFVFFVIFYSKWSLDQEYYFSMIMCLLMPVIWIVLYFVGQLGKKFGYDQMVGLHNLLIKALRNFKSIRD
jgi:hypothetical protein